MKRLFLIVICALCWNRAFAQTLYVPSPQYATIQSAINDADNDDTIIVSAGTYKENINFLGKAITVQSDDPNDPNTVATTIIDGSNPADPNIGSVVTFANQEEPNSILSGFTIQNGTAQSDPTVDWRIWNGDNGDGGGAFCSNASPTITKNIFKNCSAQYGGGGVFCHNDASPVITYSTFLNNYAGWYGGAIFARLNCSPTISNNIIKANECQHLGGAIYLADQAYSKITNNWIEGNISEHLSGGGIYYFVNSAPTIACNFFIGNISKVTGSAIMASSVSTGLIANNVFISNKLTTSSSYGAAIALYSPPVISNNIIISNKGNGIYVSTGLTVSVHNNDVWGNELADYAGDITNQTGINGNISTDPLLGAILPVPLTVYELEPNSPCRDAGNNSDLPVWLVTDYDDTARIVNGIIDIGPQEYDAIAVPQDFQTIQSAVNAAATGDKIIVSPGFYQENIDFLGKNIRLRSLNPLDSNCVEQTIIDGNDLASCITLDSGEDKLSIIAGLTIQNGYDEFGGGIYIADNCGATILYNQIKNNMAYRYGGGIDTRHYSDTVIEYNTIKDNHAKNAGGGIHVGGGATCRIYKNHITKNQTDYARQGGGIYCYNLSNVDIIENEISQNWSSSGGGIYTWKGNGTIARNHIWGNFGRALGGGIALHPSFGAPFTKMTIANNLIEGNVTEEHGGGILLRQGITSIINNTIVGNISAADSGAGIALQSGAYAEITNNIIADNLGGSGIHVEPTSPPNLLVDPDIGSNDLWNNQAGNYTGINYAAEPIDRTGLEGNISADPCFVTPGHWDNNSTPADANDDYWAHGNYHIGYFSPCRDSGSDVNAPNEDFDANQRPIFEGFDIGAYELAIYDLSANGTVDFGDLQLLLNQWLNIGAPLLMDLNADGIVDWRDYALLADDWRH